MSNKKIVNPNYITSKKLTRLEEFQEVVGVLNRVYEEEGELIAVFQIDYEIILSNDRKLSKQLEQMIGKRIGILRTDYNRKPFLLRDADKTTKPKNAHGFSRG
jgi:hypothetical protein